MLFFLLLLLYPLSFLYYFDFLLFIILFLTVAKITRDSIVDGFHHILTGLFFPEVQIHFIRLLLPHVTILHQPINEIYIFIIIFLSHSNIRFPPNQKKTDFGPDLKTFVKKQANKNGKGCFWRGNGVKKYYFFNFGRAR